MKKLLFTVIGFMFAVSTAFASPSDRVDFATMSKADTQMLFGHHNMSQQAALLNEDEMHQTQAKGWFRRIFTPSNILRVVGVIAHFYPPTAAASIGFGSWWNTYTAGYMWAF